MYQGQAPSREKEEAYLVYRPELPFSWHEMVEQKKALSPAEVLEHLKLARQQLVETPGPHQEQRIENAPKWLGWWIEFFERFGEDLDSKKAGRKFLTREEVAFRNVGYNRRGIPTADYFANGLEGNEAHRFAIDYISSIIDDGFVGLFLDEEITPGKPRSSHFLPLELRMCMWAYFFACDETHGKRFTGLNYIAIIPKKPADESTNDFYDRIHVESRARYHFVMKSDPHFQEKMRRNYLYDETKDGDFADMAFDEESADRDDTFSRVSFAEQKHVPRTTYMTHRLLSPPDVPELPPT